MRKNIIKILIMVAIFVIFVCNMTVFATFKDIDNHWAEETIKEFVEKGYIEENEENFEPDEEIEKGELTSIVNHYFSYGETSSDDENLKLAEEKGYLFNSSAEEKITREEVAILICRILSLSPNENGNTEYTKESSGEDISLLKITDENSKFVDSDKISEWAKGYVYALENEKIIIGYPDMEYKPQKNITKAEFVTILNRCIGIGGNDLELIDSEIEAIDVGIFEYEEGKTIVKSIIESIEIKLGDEIVLALMLPENIDEEEVTVEIANENIAKFDKELCVLYGLEKGTTEITFKSKNEVYKNTFKIIVVE